MTVQTAAISLAGVVIGLSSLDAQQATTRRSTAAWQEIQGFNIVLVVGESQRSGSSNEDVPVAARRALNDMREFLPYKHYRVLDSQWTSCCSPESVRVGSAIAGRLQGVAGGLGPNGTTVLVPRSYAFSLTVTQNNEPARLAVRFTLRQDDGGSGGGRGTQASRANEASLENRAADLRAQMETLAVRIRETQRRYEAGVVPPTELRELQDKHAQLERRLAETMNAVHGQGSGGGGSFRAVVDSSFTMDVGETVVVGTSRLGGDKALIALVTAVRRSTSSR